MLNFSALRGNVIGRANAAANTAFYAVVPGYADKFTRLMGFQYTAGNTANDFVLMRPIGRANATAAYNTSVAVAVLNGDPSPTGNTIAALDQVVVKHTDGTYRRYTVNTSGWDANTNTVTFTGNFGAAVASGAPFFLFGVSTDTEVTTGLAFPSLPTTANTTAAYNFANAGGFAGFNTGDPLMIYNGNATNATVMTYAEFARTVE